MTIYQKKFNLPDSWGDEWIEVKKSDVAFNIMREVEKDRQNDIIKEFNRGGEIELGFFKFRKIEK